MSDTIINILVSFLLIGTILVAEGATKKSEGPTIGQLRS